jgi:hypothetical protein
MIIMNQKESREDKEFHEQFILSSSPIDEQQCSEINKLTYSILEPGSVENIKQNVINSGSSFQLFPITSQASKMKILASSKEQAIHKGSLFIWSRNTVILLSIQR